MWNMGMINSKEITRKLIAEEHRWFKDYEPDVQEIVRKVFAEIAKQVAAGEKVLVKNFGTFQQMPRIPRRRFDQGMKAAVITDPKKLILFTQSPNVFRTDEEEAQEGEINEEEQAE